MILPFLCLLTVTTNIFDFSRFVNFDAQSAEKIEMLERTAIVIDGTIF